jgi:hypothetical protein
MALRKTEIGYGDQKLENSRNIQFLISTFYYYFPISVLLISFSVYHTDGRGAQQDQLILRRNPPGDSSGEYKAIEDKPCKKPFDGKDDSLLPYEKYQEFSDEKYMKEE